MSKHLIHASNLVFAFPKMSGLKVSRSNIATSWFTRSNLGAVENLSKGPIGRDRRRSTKSPYSLFWTMSGHLFRLYLNIWKWQVSPRWTRSSETHTCQFKCVRLKDVGSGGLRDLVCAKMASYRGHQERRYHLDPIAKDPISGLGPGSMWLKRDVSPFMIQVWCGQHCRLDWISYQFRRYRFNNLRKPHLIWKPIRQQSTID